MLNIAADVGELIGQLRLQGGCQGFPRFRILGDDDELGVIIGRKDGLDGQDEPRCPLADVVGVILQLILLAVEVPGQPGRFFLGRFHRGALRQGHFNDQFRPQGRREKFFRNKIGQSGRNDEDCSRPADDDDAMGQAPVQDLTEKDVEPTGIQLFRGLALFLFGLDEVIAEERRYHDRYDPRQDQRCRDDRKQGFTKFSSGAIGKGDGNEAGAGNEGPGQHGFSRSPKGVAGGVDTAPPFFELNGHHFDGDDGVVDEEAQGDDQGP